MMHHGNDANVLSGFVVAVKQVIRKAFHSEDARAASCQLITVWMLQHLSHGRFYRFGELHAKR